MTCHEGDCPASTLGEEELAHDRILTVNEPACGAGGMVIALLEAFQEKGFDWQNRVYVVAQDIDETCFRMAYIQLALLGVSATVVLGDTIALNSRRAWNTPVCELSFMEARLHVQQRDEEGTAIPSSAVSELEIPITVTSQLELFAS